MLSGDDGIVIAFHKPLVTFSFQPVEMFFGKPYTRHVVGKRCTRKPSPVISLATGRGAGHRAPEQNLDKFET